MARVGTGHCTQRDAPDTVDVRHRVMSRQESVNVQKGRRCCAGVMTTGRGDGEIGRLLSVL